MPYLYRCTQCGTTFEQLRSNQKFCGKACASEFQKQKWRLQNPKSPLGIVATGTTAEINEMRVTIDLLQRGFEVYRAAFQGMPCDMLIRKMEWPATQSIRVEVTTGNRTAAGTVVHPDRDAATFDVLAVVLGDGNIVYKPEIGASQ